MPGVSPYQVAESVGDSEPSVRVHVRTLSRRSGDHSVWCALSPETVNDPNREMLLHLVDFVSVVHERGTFDKITSVAVQEGVS